MTKKTKIAELEDSISRFYEKYSARRLVLATVVVVVISLLASWAIYTGLQSGLYAAIAFLLVGFIGINIAFLTVVPPASELKQAKGLMLAAIKDPERIKSYDMKKVKLVDGQGKVHQLGPRELGVWTSLVVPYLITMPRGEVAATERPQRKLTASERKYIEQRRKEVLEMEKKIEDERAKLETDRRELEVRSADLKEAEELVITRLTGVEQAEAEIEQLKIVAAERADVDAAAYDAQAAELKAAELKAKEAELVELKERLARDRQNFESQKAELKQLQQSVTRSPFPASVGAAADQSIEAREAALLARQQQLEAEAAELEMRSNFVADSENSLIERLDALTEREAHIEQSEIDAGLRQD